MGGERDPDVVVTGMVLTDLKAADDGPSDGRGLIVKVFV